MSLEGQLLDHKSLRAVTGKTAEWNEIAKDCIAFANATGGRLLIGIEDGQDAPPANQQIPVELPDTLRRKLAERTVNVTALPDVITAPNGGQYIELRIPRAMAVASTTDGRYFLRVADQSKPVTGDDVMRLASELHYHGKHKQLCIFPAAKQKLLNEASFCRHCAPRTVLNPQ